MSEVMVNRIRKLSKREQKNLYAKLDIYEELIHFWHIVDETISTYKNCAAKRALCEWLEFLSVEHGSLMGMARWQRTSVQDLMLFKEFLYELGGKDGRRCESTVEQRMQILKRVSIRLFNFGLLKVTPWLDLKIKTKVSRPYKAPRLSSKEIKIILDDCNLKSYAGRRDYAMFACLIGAGLRVGEVAKLTCKDVRETERGRVYLHLRKTKNGQDYLQPLPSNFGKAVINLKHDVVERAGEDSNLFLKFYKNGKVRELKRDAIRMMIYRRCERLGLDFTTTHSFRVTAITRLLENKIPLQDVKKFARHESVTTTLLYDRSAVNVHDDVVNILDFIK